METSAEAPPLDQDGRTGAPTTSRLFGSRSSRVALAAVMLFCVVTRVGWVLHIRDSHPAATTSQDTPSYVQPAQALARDGTLNARPGRDEPIFVRTPGYPALMGAVFAVDESETLFLLAQVILSCLTVLLAYAIAARLWGPVVGVLAAAFLALEPLQFAASGTLLTESVFSLALLVVVAVAFHVFGRDSPRLASYALLGLAIAIATMIRPTTYYFPIVVIAFIALRYHRRGVRTVVAGLAVFLAPVVLLVGGWQLRNHEEVGSWRFSGVEAVNVYDYYAAYALASHDGTSIAAAREKLDHRLRSSPLASCPTNGRCAPARPTRPGPFYDELYDRGFTVVKSYPTEAAKGAVEGLSRELFGPGSDTVGRYLDVGSSAILSGMLGIELVCFAVASGYGLFVVFRKRAGRGPGHLFALGTAAYVLLISAGPEAYARFRGPIMPIVALYAGLGVATGCARVRARWGRRSVRTRLTPAAERHK